VLAPVEELRDLHAGAADSPATPAPAATAVLADLVREKNLRRAEHNLRYGQQVLEALVLAALPDLAAHRLKGVAVAL
jgi:hypothetical protein